MDTTAKVSVRGGEGREWMRQRLVAVSIELAKMHGEAFAHAFLEDVGVSPGCPMFGLAESSLD